MSNSIVPVVKCCRGRPIPPVVVLGTETRRHGTGKASRYQRQLNECSSELHGKQKSVSATEVVVNKCWGGRNFIRTSLYHRDNLYSLK